MKLKVLYDSELSSPEFKSGWGLSLLVDENILFDCGREFDILSHNAALMGVDLNKIEKVIISHEHKDHSGGLWGLLEINKDVAVYVCRGFNSKFKKKIKRSGVKLVEVKDIAAIDEDIYSLGQNPVLYKGNKLVEQMLILKTGQGINIVSACAHPGVVNIVHKAKMHFGRDVDYLIGGLHLSDKKNEFVNYIVADLTWVVRRLALGHCTGAAAMKLLAAAYKKNMKVLKVGLEVDI